MSAKADRPNGQSNPEEKLDAKEKIVMDRRAFLAGTSAAAGGAAVFGFFLPSGSAEAAEAPKSVAKAVAKTVAKSTPAAPGSVPPGSLRLGGMREGTAVAAQPWYHEATVPEINAWITIAPDDTVTIRIAQTECGTGVLTCNAMIIAEELQCDWSKVRVEYADTNRDYREKAPEWTLKPPGHGVTDPGGAAPTAISENQNGVYRKMILASSSNVRESRYYLQQAGASARHQLLQAAAEGWSVPVSELVAKDSVITHAKSNRRVNYGAIAEKASRIELVDPANTVKIKTPDQYTLLGTEQRNFDIPLKVTGQAVYGIDIRLPNMLYGNVKSCPVWGGDVKSYNADAIKNMPGVIAVVPLPFSAKNRRSGFMSGGVGVVADTWWHAKKAVDALPVEWDNGRNTGVSSASIYDEHIGAITKPGAVLTDHGNIDDAMGKGAKIIEAEYQVPYAGIARMEPGDATVLVTDDRVDVWSGDQNPQQIYRYSGSLTGVPLENVYLHSTFQGGGYGDGGHGDQGQKAVVLAAAVKGRPVKMLWTREEDWARGTRYRPFSVCRMRAAVDADGWPIAVECRHATTWAGDMGFRGLSAFPYFVPNYRLTMHYPVAHVPISTKRATGAQPNDFYIETFIDELAHAAGMDSYKYRRELISRNPPQPRRGVGGFHRRDDWLRALDMVVKQSDWGSPLPKGQARGIAITDRRRPTRASCTICAQVHRVEVSKEGRLKLQRVDVVFERGFAFMHPVAVAKQIEGQMGWGYDEAVHQGTTIKDGAAVEENFNTFQVGRMNEYPREVHISYFNTNYWITGAAEEAIPAVTPGILNAVFNVTGKRFRAIPLKGQDLSWA
jgi:isoquinoline 1-oxidoreductase beta subunit